MPVSAAVRRGWIPAALAGAALALAGSPAHVAAGPADVTVSTPLQAPAGDLPTGPRPNGTAVLPSGRFVTPFGRTTTVDLLPTRLVVSHDGQRLYASSEGMDSEPSPSAYTDSDFDRYVSVLDTATLTRTDRPRDDSLHYGLAEAPDGRSLYVSEGKTGSLGVMTRGADGRLTRTSGVSIGAESYPWGLALTRDGGTAFVTGFSANTLNVLDTASGTKLATTGAGEYPTDVALSPDGTKAYVTNWGLYNQDSEANPARPATGGIPVTVPPLTVAGYNGPGQSSLWIYDVRDRTRPVVTAKVRIGADINGGTVVGGSTPTAVAVSPDGRTLAVAASNHDLVELRDATTGALVRRIDLRAIAGGPTGAQPAAVAWAPDGRTLYVAEAGRDAVAVLDPATGVARGRIPTAWYPTSLAVSPDGQHLYVASSKGFGAGPNDVGPAHAADKLGTDTSYLPNKLQGVVQDVDLSAASCVLPALTATVQRNNGLLTAAGSDPSGGVVPASYGSGPSQTVKHVVFVLKENRTYDQVFGDLAGTERAQRTAYYSGSVTPNQHALAQEYGSSDNYYSTAQTSYDGHYAADTGQANEWATKLSPLSYANKLPRDRFVSSPENIPLGGFLWNNYARQGVSFRIYGEATYLIGLSPTVLNAGPSAGNLLPPAFYALGGPGSPGGFSATYPSQVTQQVPITSSASTDEDRADDFLRELDRFSLAGTMPSFQQLSLPDDHTDGARPGSPTPQTYVARNDHAVGRIIEGLSKSPFWKDTAVFVTEDDTQDGQDHVDASRSFVLVAGGNVRKGAVSRVHTSTLSVLKTMNLLLGVPPTSLDELTSTSLADLFSPQPRTEAFRTRPNVTGTATNPPYPPASATGPAAAASRLMQQVPPGVDAGGALLQTALALQAQAAAADGSAQVPPTPDVTERRLPDGSPPVAPTGCVDAAPAVRTPPDGVAAPSDVGTGTTPADDGRGARRLAATGGSLALPAVALAVVGLAAALRRRRLGTRERQPGN